MSVKPSRAMSLSDFGRLGLGAANAGNLFAEMTDDEAFGMFETAWNDGIRHFDTAPHYGLGLSEERLGAFLREKPRAEFHLSTKVGRLLVSNDDFAGESDPFHFAVPATRCRVVDYSRDGIRRSLEESLIRMGLDRIDTVYVHDPEQHGAGNTTGILQSAIPEVRELCDEGVVSHAGVGTGAVAAARTAVAMGGFDVLMLAGRYTLLEQPAYPELLADCRAAEIGIINTAQFNSGLLATTSPSRDSHYDYGSVPPHKLERAILLAEVCRRHDVELPTAALQFGFQHPQVVAVVMGAASAEQVVENLTRMSTAIPAELWGELRDEGLIP